MKPYKNFRIAAYVFAYYLKDASDEQIQSDIDFYRQYIPLEKVYIENHRGVVDISQQRLQEVRHFLKRTESSHPVVSLLPKMSMASESPLTMTPSAIPILHIVRNTAAS